MSSTELCPEPIDDQLYQAVFGYDGNRSAMRRGAPIEEAILALNPTPMGTVGYRGSGGGEQVHATTYNVGGACITLLTSSEACWMGAFHFPGTFTSITGPEEDVATIVQAICESTELELPNIEPMKKIKVSR